MAYFRATSHSSQIYSPSTANKLLSTVEVYNLDDIESTDTENPFGDTPPTKHRDSYRKSLQTSQGQHQSNDSSNSDNNGDMDDEINRQLVIFGCINISNLSPLLQYIILSTGLLVFMCLYGYYQVRRNRGSKLLTEITIISLLS